MDYEKILNDVAEELGFGGVSDEKKAELIGKMGEALMKRILLETFNRLGDAGVKEYDELIDRGGTQEEISAFLKSRIPDYEDMLMKVVLEFKQSMQENTLGAPLEV